MLEKTIQKALNKQINAELYSAYLYLSMSAYPASVGLAGFSQWMLDKELGSRAFPAPLAPASE
ncbi:MAG: hypothetical protein JRI36_05840 [Deltaproteobacteria bacterium]|nr:hypothetical protein [Deltaproteobacteria bacterium]